MNVPFLRSLLLALILCAAFAASAFSQTADPRWNALSTIKPGTRLVVDVDAQRSMTVKFVRADDRSLVVARDGRETELARSAVSAVHLGQRSSRMKRGLIGALAGAGAGVLIGVIATTTAKADPLTAAGGFLIGIPVGAVVGAATGGKTRKGALIYSR